MVMITWFLLAVTILMPIFVRGDDESMAKLVRPKVFINIEELKEYLDVVKDYYNMNGKGRYGKRGGNTPHFLVSPKYPQRSMELKPDTLEPKYRDIKVSRADFRPHKLQRLQPNGLLDNN